MPDLRLSSICKQHNQLERSQRRSGGLMYFLGTSSRNGGIVQKLSELYWRVKELRALVMTEEILSSVTLTELHRLMVKALKPVSEQVSALYGEIMGPCLSDSRWRKRKKAVRQKVKEDWGAKD